MSSPAVTVPDAPAAHNALDLVALSLASLGTAIAWGAFVAGLIAIIAGVAWGAVVYSSARRAARTAALEHMRDVSPKLVREWLEVNLPQYLREFKDMKSDDTDKDRKPDFDATAIGNYADEPPKGQPVHHQGPLEQDAGSSGNDRR